MFNGWHLIAGCLSDHGIQVSIVTNGYQVSDALIARCKESRIVSAGVSLDGIRTVHDALRHEGSFDCADRAIKKFIDAGIPVSVITTLSSENADYCSELYMYLRELPIYAWQIQACVPMGYARSNSLEYRFDVKKIIEFIRKEAPTAPFIMGIAHNVGYYTEEEGFIRGNTSGFACFTGCTAGISSVSIDSQGNIKGCASMQDACFIEGNVRANSISEIWENPDLFAYNRKFSRTCLKGHCAECDYGEICKAGCRSYNFFTSGGLFCSPDCARIGSEC